MDIPKYLKILWNYKWLLVFGLVVAAAAAVLAGFRIEQGTFETRVEQMYRASTTILIGSPDQSIFEAEIPGETVEQGETPPQARDLTQTAVVFAYIVSGSTIRTEVEARIGELDELEGISAVRRTTQPAGDESTPGRFSLPIMDIVGVSTDPVRAEEISRTANEVFQEYVTTRQNESAIEETSRVTLETLDEGRALNVTGSNSAVPLVVTGLGVFLAFIVLAFVLNNIRTRRKLRIRSRSRRTARTGRAASAPPTVRAH
jgi:capsular polysaccharide biosynthesis protein